MQADVLQASADQHAESFIDPGTVDPAPYFGANDIALQRKIELAAGRDSRTVPDFGRDDDLPLVRNGDGCRD